MFTQIFFHLDFIQLKRKNLLLDNKGVQEGLLYTPCQEWPNRNFALKYQYFFKQNDVKKEKNITNGIFVFFIACKFSELKF